MRDADSSKTRQIRIAPPTFNRVFNGSPLGPQNRELSSRQDRSDPFRQASAKIHPTASEVLPGRLGTKDSAEGSNEFGHQSSFLRTGSVLLPSGARPQIRNEQAAVF